MAGYRASRAPRRCGHHGTSNQSTSHRGGTCKMPKERCNITKNQHPATFAAGLPGLLAVTGESALPEPLQGPGSPVCPASPRSQCSGCWGQSSMPTRRNIQRLLLSWHRGVSWQLRVYGLAVKIWARATSYHASTCKWNMQIRQPLPHRRSS